MPPSSRQLSRSTFTKEAIFFQIHDSWWNRWHNSRVEWFRFLGPRRGFSWGIQKQNGFSLTPIIYPSYSQHWVWRKNSLTKLWRNHSSFYEPFNLISQLCSRDDTYKKEDPLTIFLITPILQATSLACPYLQRGHLHYTQQSIEIDPTNSTSSNYKYLPTSSIDCKSKSDDFSHLRQVSI